MEKITPAVYAVVGAVVVGILVWTLGWLVPKLVGKSIDTRFEKKDREEQEYRKEQIEDALRQQEGQQVMTDSLLVILRHMITGNHVEYLQKAQKKSGRLPKQKRESDALESHQIQSEVENDHISAAIHRRLSNQPKIRRNHHGSKRPYRH